MPWMLQYIFCFSMGNLNKFNIGLMRKVHTCKVVTEMGYLKYKYLFKKNCKSIFEKFA
jgi:hypothetical protein